MRGQRRTDRLFFDGLRDEAGCWPRALGTLELFEGQLQLRDLKVEGFGAAAEALLAQSAEQYLKMLDLQLLGGDKGIALQHHLFEHVNIVR